MQVLDAKVDLEAFVEQLARAREGVLVLDYDGTLAPCRVDRDRAFPYPGVKEALNRIAMLANTRLAIVTGRPVHDIPSLLGFEGLGLERYRPEIWGCHGWERLLPDGTYYRARPHQWAMEGLSLAYGSIWELTCGRLGPWFPIEGRIERKPVGLAFHWRGCTPAIVAEVQDSVTQEWAGLARDTGLELSVFEEGVELRVPGHTKADAVETMMEDSGKGAAGAFLGGDVTDEDAFRALKGKALTALVRSEVRPSAADLWMQPPDELCEFLGLWEELRTRPASIAWSIA